jgi:hypothetical protein
MEAGRGYRKHPSRCGKTMADTGKKYQTHIKEQPKTRCIYLQIKISEGVDTLYELEYKRGEQKEKDMDEKIQEAFHTSIGAVLNYLDEAEASFMLKKAIRSELWELCDKKIKPLIGKGSGYGQNEQRGNC